MKTQSKDEKTIVEIQKDQYRENLIKYTRKAFHTLPPLENPLILDVGCGSGVPAIELVRLCNGNIIALDIDQTKLDIFKKKVKDAGLNNRIQIIKRSLLQLNFPDEYFDIIWTEGSIFVIGFEKGLKEWYHFIKPGGYLVVHDEIKAMSEKKDIIQQCGYILIDTIVIPEEVWWNVYCEPLEKQIMKLMKKYKGNETMTALLQDEQNKIDKFENKPELFTSIFYIMQKR
jgi:ubiquinone/menaquinone biosynthesis C-methylase UbiE